MKHFAYLFLSILTIMGFYSCSKKEQSTANPFFEERWETPYGIPPFDRIANDHFVPAFEEGMRQHLAEIDSIVSCDEKPTFDNTILAYDKAGAMLQRVSSVFSMLNSAETNPEMQAISEQMMPRLAAHNDAIQMNDALFARIDAVYNARHSLALSAEQLRLVEKIHTRFVRSGALLSEELKAELKAINSELSLLQVRFGNNLLAETTSYKMVLTSAQLGGLPATVREAAAEKARQEGKVGNYIFTLDKPSLIPFLTYSTERALREQLYKAYISRGNNDNEHDNKQIASRMASLRYQKAHLLGYRSYADYVTSNQMAGSPEAVFELLDGIWVEALRTAERELADMKPSFIADNGEEATFEPWDWWYYAEKLRVKRYNLEEAKVREYLALDNVKGGIFTLANRLYGITFRPIKAALYHAEVEAYEVIDNNDAPLGVLLFDFHPRAGKSGGAWCGRYVPQSYDATGKRVPPVVSIVCNFTRPSGSTPALLSIDETETLFHEFGHALHSLFAEVKYAGLRGVEGDFVELPSQIMENWAFTTAMLRQYAVHYRKDDVMPDDMIRRIHRSSKFNEGFAMTELLAAAFADMEIHSLTSADEVDVKAFEQKVLGEKRGLIPQISPRYHYTYFSHIFDGGYSAGYYFYIWAEVLDKDAFQAFVESGDLFNAEVAARFREEVLSRGGTRGGMDMYRAFRGADPDKRALMIARGFIDDYNLDIEEYDPSAPVEVIRVDTREQARRIAEESRRRRAEEQAQKEAEEAMAKPQPIVIATTEAADTEAAESGKSEEATVVEEATGEGVEPTEQEAAAPAETQAPAEMAAPAEIHAIEERALPTDAEPTSIGRIEGAAALPARRGIEAVEAVEATGSATAVAEPE